LFRNAMISDYMKQRAAICAKLYYRHKTETQPIIFKLHQSTMYLILSFLCKANAKATVDYKKYSAAVKNRDYKSKRFSDIDSHFTGFYNYRKSTNWRKNRKTTIRVETPVPENRNNEKDFDKVEIVQSEDIEEVAKVPKPFREAKRISCSKTTAYSLCFFVFIAIILSSLITFWITKDIYNRQSQSLWLQNDSESEKSETVSEQLAMVEDELDAPAAEELRLPKNLIPLRYNVTIKTYVPGFADFHEGKNLTIDAAAIIIFRVEEPTDKIVLNAYKLEFVDDSTKYKLAQYIEREPVEYEDTIETHDANFGNATANNEHDETADISTSILESIGQSEELEDETTLPSHFLVEHALEPIEITKIVVNETLQMVIFQLNEELKKGGEYHLKLLYKGLIEKEFAGIYLSQYYDNSGLSGFATVAQARPNNARRIVPCFDEPEFKAIWKIKIIHPKGTTAISNGKEIHDALETDDVNWLSTSFEETLPMSSYLFAFIVTDFPFNEGVTDKGVRFRIWSRKEVLSYTDYALKSGMKALEFFEDYFKIEFPLKKQDIIALPDFAAFSSDSWGLSITQEQNILYDSNLYEPFIRIRVLLTIAHELAHQWFGNLVTMKWWNDLWLNEGFATFVQYMGADAISSKKFRLDEYFLSNTLRRALQRDARSTSHPLLYPIDKAEDVIGAMDIITYDKGASIVHMIENMLGKENFRKGLKIFLEKHKFANADHDDFWESFNEVLPNHLKAWNGDKLDIRKFAEHWTEQMGYPVIEVHRLDARTVELQQKRFKWNGNTLEKKKYRNAKYWYKYEIPIWYQINSEEKPMTWLHQAKSLQVKPNDLFILNSQSRGFYRVNYDHTSWERIRQQLLEDHTRIDVKSRARIIGDMFALAQTGMLPYDLVLNISKYLVKEKDLLPWTVAMKGFDEILNIFGDEPETQAVRDYLESILQPIYDTNDWSKLDNTNPFFENELEAIIIHQYCKIRAISCINRLADIFKQDFLEHCKDNDISSACSRVPIGIRSKVYCEGVKQNVEQIWDKIKGLYERETIQVERKRLLRALACSRDPMALKTLLDSALDVNNSLILLHDAPFVFRSVSKGDVGRLVIFNYFLDNWPRIYNALKGQQLFLKSIIRSSIDLKHERDLEQIWFDENFDKLYAWFRKIKEPL
uniref:Aminopeptidase N n=1 Tax=Dracunculus medinensis TaxID=318479 RepID=A0A0N4U4M2_DRAME